MDKISLTGASGFVGKEILKRSGDRYSFVTPGRKELYADTEQLAAIIEGSRVVIHLAGKPIVGRWTRKTKREILESRVFSTRNLVESFRRLQQKPEIFICASAVGIYRDGPVHTESSQAYSEDFLQEVVRAWESEAEKAKDLGIRTIMMRIGVVLGKNGGMLRRLHPIFRAGLGGTIGKGTQGFSFIHIDDLCGAVEHFIKEKSTEGTYNLVAPEPVDNKIFTRTFAKILKRPAIFRIPVLFLKMLYGQGANVLTRGQKVRPERLIESGFRFSFPTIEETLKDLYTGSTKQQ